MSAQVAHSQQHQRRVARQSQEMAEAKDEDDRLQAGPVGEARQGRRSFGLKEGNSQNVWNDE